MPRGERPTGRGFLDYVTGRATIEDEMTVTSAPAAPATSMATNDLLIALDMLKNFNFSQLGDAIAAAANDPVTAVEDVANIAVQAATVAGVPFAGTAQAALPMIENLFNFARTTFHLFGGASGQAATTSVAISSPAGVSAASTVKGS